MGSVPGTHRAYRVDSHLHFYSVCTEVLYHIDLRGQHANLPSPCQAKQGNNPTAHKPSMTLNPRGLDANLPHTAMVPGINLPVEEVHSGTHAVSSAKISPQCPWHIEAAAHTGRAGGCTSTQDAGSQAKAANSRKADSVRFMCYLGLVARAGTHPSATRPKARAESNIPTPHILQGRGEREKQNAHTRLC